MSQDGLSEDSPKLELLRLKIDAGVEALTRGNFVELDETDLERYLECLTVE